MNVWLFLPKREFGSRQMFKGQTELFLFFYIEVKNEILTMGRAVKEFYDSQKSF